MTASRTREDASPATRDTTKGDRKPATPEEIAAERDRLRIVEDNPYFD